MSYPEKSASETSGTSGQIRAEALKAFHKAALKAAEYLEDVFTPGGDNADAGKEYNSFTLERANIALKLLDIAFSPNK
jgi:hypothetical protein